MSELKFYEPKLKTNSVKFCFWILTCSIFSFVISYFYGVFSIIPYVFIKITVVIFFSLILGLFVRYSSKKFHILSAKIVQYSGTFFILLTLYFSWNSFFLFLDYRTDSFFRYFFKPIQFANPESLFEYFRLLNSSSKISLNNPNNYNIVYSLLKVVLEFITMKVILTRLLNSIKHSPYSITLNKYYKKYSLNKKFKQIPISAQDNIAENCSAFVKHISSNQNESVYSEIEVYYLEKENCQYLSISNFNFEGKITKEMIICYQEISTNDAKILLEEYYD